MVRVIMIAVVVALLAACSSQVVRENGARSSRGVSAAKYGETVAVRRGDTLYRLATNNGISALDLAMWNNIAAPYTIYPGQRLRLYPNDARRTTVATGVARPTTPSTTRTPGANNPAIRPAAPAKADVVKASFAWRWPADGQVVGTYAAGDPTRQGVDIAGTGGQPVRAAADGVVVYSGSGLVGYGELIIVKHSDEWLSAYGHNRARLVNEGQVVKAGQQIAEMGRSGAARDMLHFEIRYNGKPVDPQQHLPRR